MEAIERLDLRVRQAPHATGLVETEVVRTGRRFQARCGCGVSTRLVGTEAKAGEDAMNHVAAERRKEQELLALTAKRKQVFRCSIDGAEVYEVPVKIGDQEVCRLHARLRLENQTEASFWEPVW